MWDKQVPGCFGSNDLIFAGHPLDENRAFEWLVDLRKRGIGWKAARAQLVAFLKSERAGPDHIRQQLASTGKHLKPWLLD